MTTNLRVLPHYYQRPKTTKVYNRLDWVQSTAHYHHSKCDIIVSIMILIIINIMILIIIINIIIIIIISIINRGGRTG